MAGWLHLPANVTIVVRIIIPKQPWYRIPYCMVQPLGFLTQQLQKGAHFELLEASSREDLAFRSLRFRWRPEVFHNLIWVGILCVPVYDHGEAGHAFWRPLSKEVVCYGCRLPSSNGSFQIPRSSTTFKELEHNCREWLEHNSFFPFHRTTGKGLNLCKLKGPVAGKTGGTSINTTQPTFRVQR